MCCVCTVAHICFVNWIDRATIYRLNASKIIMKNLFKTSRLVQSTKQKCARVCVLRARRMWEKGKWWESKRNSLAECGRHKSVKLIECLLTIANCTRHKNKWNNKATSIWWKTTIGKTNTVPLGFVVCFCLDCAWICVIHFLTN